METPNPADNQSLEQAAKEYASKHERDFYYSSPEYALKIGFLACGRSEWHRREMERVSVEFSLWLQRNYYKVDIDSFILNYDGNTIDKATRFSTEQLFQKFMEEQK